MDGRGSLGHEQEIEFIERRLEMVLPRECDSLARLPAARLEMELYKDALARFRSDLQVAGLPEPAVGKVTAVFACASSATALVRAADDAAVQGVHATLPPRSVDEVM